jgi:hypothetical protein
MQLNDNVENIELASLPRSGRVKNTQCMDSMLIVPGYISVHLSCYLVGDGAVFSAVGPVH